MRSVHPEREALCPGPGLSPRKGVEEERVEWLVWEGAGESCWACRSPGQGHRAPPAAGVDLNPAPTGAPRRPPVDFDSRGVMCVNVRTGSGVGVEPAELP